MLPRNKIQRIQRLGWTRLLSAPKIYPGPTVPNLHGAFSIGTLPIQQPNKVYKRFQGYTTPEKTSCSKGLQYPVLV